ncbi:kelch-like protein 33 [Microcaecilia unicolor]|uniref:Kelch-like protein 33 n=1 Tax=Microcaecilia unicolor TaxID=1415580 RepID=A0A6P7WYL0_9AMPH|nr:kelch-like protein 33 [Microcaecilia unicolor]
MSYMEGSQGDPSSTRSRDLCGKMDAGTLEQEKESSVDLQELQNLDYVDDFFCSLCQLREQGLLVDICLALEGRLYQTHCLPLAAVSTFFAEILEQGQRNMVDLEGKATCCGLEALLDFAYEGHCDVSKDSAMEVLRVSEALGAPRVAALCKQFLNPALQDHKEVLASEEKLQNLRGIQELQRHGIGWDLELQADGISLKVHRVILAAGSDFFRGMFTSGMKEAHQDMVSLSTFSSADLSLFISFIYSGSLLLGWDNVFEVTEAALPYQMSGILQLCYRFFRENMESEHSLDVLALAEAFDLPELRQETEDFILRNFKEVAQVPKFQDLKMDQLVALLSQDGLYTTMEFEVFQAVLCWVDEDREARLSQAAKVMKCVRFPLMTNRELRQVIAADLMAPSEKCYKVLEASLLSVPKGPSVLSQLPCRIRLPSHVLVIVGGDSLTRNLSSRVPSQDLWFAHRFISGIGLVKHIEWKALSTLPDMPRFRHAVAVLDNILYVFGGNHFYGKEDVLKSVVRYDPLQDTWERLADMQERHNYFQAVSLGGLLYVLGGNPDNSNTQCLDTVECYDPAKNSWKFVHPLPLPLCGHAAAVSGGKIYVSGGCTGIYHILRDLFHYDPAAGSTHLSPMTHVRGGHVMEALGERLYVAGGLSHGERGYMDLYACEVYSPAEDSWTDIAPLTHTHVVAASVTFLGELYVLGGYSYETYKDTHLVHCYNPKSDRWVNLGTMPKAYTDMKACVLSLPSHLRERTPET